MRRTFSFVFLAGILGVGAVGCSASQGNLKKTAAIDLSCPQKQLEVDELDKSRAGALYLVTGCGRSAQYTVTKKVAVRSSDVTAEAPRPVPPPPAAPAAPTAQQQANFNAFMADHDQRFAQQQAQQQAVLAAPTKKPAAVGRVEPQPPSSPTPEPSPSPAPASTPAVNQSGYVCLNGDYHACPTIESTSALAAYAKCRFDCALGGNCSKCDVGAGKDCKRDSSRDPSCK